MVQTSEKTYSVFISYCGKDNNLRSNWTPRFITMLEETLISHISNSEHFDSVHDYNDERITHGSLNGSLATRVENSNCMLAIIGKHYTKSNACMHELESFAKHFGNEGLESRLFIIALTEGSKRIFKEHKWYKENLPGDQIFNDFFEPNDKEWPIVIMQDNNSTTEKFDSSFKPLVSSIKKLLEQDADAESIKEVPRENNKVLVGCPTPDLFELQKNIEQELSDQRVSLLDITSISNYQNPGDLHTYMAGHDVLILPYSNAEPMFSHLGGHLEIQEKEWRRYSKKGKIIYIENISPKENNELEKKSRPSNNSGIIVTSLPELKAEVKKAMSPPISGPANSASSSESIVKIMYEDSNDPSEEGLYKNLHKRIDELWEGVGRGVDEENKLRIIMEAFNEIDMLEMIDNGLIDSDGFIILWGRKEKETVVSHVKSIRESLIKNCPKYQGMVARLIPPKTESTALYWPVIPFDKETYIEDGKSTKMLVDWLSVLKQKKIRYLEEQATESAN